jgi:5-methyltetrahydrofolate--homocysteine methyltransferase
VSYANDALTGFAIWKNSPRRCSQPESALDQDLDEEKLTGTEAKIALAARNEVIRSTPSKSKIALLPEESIPHPPFWGTRVVADVPLDNVFSYVNDVALIRGQWQVRKGRLKEEEYQKILNDKIHPEYEHLKTEVKNAPPPSGNCVWLLCVSVRGMSRYL